MIEQFHMFYHSIKDSLQHYLIFGLFTIFLGWQFLLYFLNQISQGYENKDKMDSKVLKEIKSNITLESTIRLNLMMNDYENWEDGFYKGNEELINNQTESILRTVERWQKRGSAIRNKRQL